MTRTNSLRAGLILLLGLLSGPNLQAHLPSMTVTSRYISFVTAPGTNPSTQTLGLATNEHPFEWAAEVRSLTGGPWLTISPTRGTLPGNFARVNLILSAVSSGLAAGVYYATITINAPLADNSPQVVEVALSVTATGQPASGIGVAPSVLTFDGVRGSGRSVSSSIQVSNLGGGTLNWNASADTDTGGNWLSVSPGSGTTSGILVVTASVGALSTGTYTGRVTIAAAGAANSPRLVAVSFRIRDPLPAALQLNTNALAFTAMAGTSSPPSQQLVVSNGGDGNLVWRVTNTTFNGGPWLSASPSGGSGFGVITVSAELGDLPPGVYAGRVTVTSDGALNSPAQVPVTLTVARPKPTVAHNGVVNAASFQVMPVAPGEIVSIFGSRLGPAEGVVFTLDPETRRLPESLAGTKVTFDGVAAPLFFVSANQINLQVPFEVAGRASTRMVVSVEGLDPTELLLPVGEAAPGVFTLDGTRAAVLNQDSTLNGPENPVLVGDVIQMFLTGQGLLTPAVPTGSLAPTSPPFPGPILAVSVNIDGIEGRVLFAGAAPGFAGLMQVNVEVPRGVLPSDRVRVFVGVGVYQMVWPVTIAVR